MNKLTVRFANKKYINWLTRNDHIQRKIIKLKIEQKEIIVAQLQNKLIGFMRIEFLWSIVPYIAVIKVKKEYQKQGVGKSLLQFIEKYLVKKGYKTLFTSSVVKEKEPQKWHKYMGFKKCGYIDHIQKEGREIFFYKNLRRASN